MPQMPADPIPADHASLCTALAHALDAASDGDGLQDTAWSALSIARASTPAAMATVSVQQPSLCIIAQGRKQVLLGREVYEYDASRYLLSSVDLPVTGRVVDASAEAPYLCFVLRIDPMDVTALADAAGDAGETLPPPSRGLSLGPADSALLEAALRLTRLLQTPRDLPMLAPLIVRELLYRLMHSPQGGMLRQLAISESPGQRVGRAIAWLRSHYREPLRIETIADRAHMSPSSLHAHFRAVTAMTPLQYQKQLRLQEARRLLLASHTDAASAGHAVGYGSPSQFSREYRRLFGAPPQRDIARLRTS